LLEIERCVDRPTEQFGKVDRIIIVDWFDVDESFWSSQYHDDIRRISYRDWVDRILLDPECQTIHPTKVIADSNFDKVTEIPEDKENQILGNLYASNEAEFCGIAGIFTCSDANWARLGRFAASKCQILSHSCGLVVKAQSLTVITHAAKRYSDSNLVEV